MAEDLVSQLESRTNMLEFRMQRALYRTETSHLMILRLRQRVDNLEISWKEFQERGSFPSGMEVQQNVSLRTTATVAEESDGATESQNEPACAIVEQSDYQEMDEGVLSVIRKMAKSLEAKLEAVDLSGNYLQETERESSHLEDLTQDDETSNLPSTRNEISDKSEHRTIEDPRAVKADEEEEKSIEEKEVGTEQQVDESGNKLIVSNQEVEQLKETQEADLIKTEECTDESSALGEKSQVDFEDDERISENSRQESSELQVPVKEIARDDPEGLKCLEKEPEMLVRVQTDKDTHERQQFTGATQLESVSIEESRNVTVEEKEYDSHRREGLESRLEDLETIISRELARGEFKGGRAQEGKLASQSDKLESLLHDYELESSETVWHYDEPDFSTKEELESQFSEDTIKQEAAITRKIENSVNLLADSIENSMHKALPDDVRKTLSDCFRKVVEYSLTETAVVMNSLESKLVSSNDLCHWLQMEMRRMFTEMFKRNKRDDGLRKEIRSLREDLNKRLIILQSSHDYCQQLRGKYDEVTLNIELEMKKHRTLCQDYKNLRIEYEKLKAKCETPEGACEVSDEAAAGTVSDEGEAGCAATAVEEQMAALAECHEELKLKVKSFSEGPMLIENFSLQEPKDFESLDKLRKMTLTTLESQPDSQYQLMEKLLIKTKVDRDFFWKGIISERNVTLLQVAGTDSPLLTELLLEYGFSPHEEDTEDNTPLHNAAVRGNVRVGGALIKAGAHINSLNSLKMTPLHLSLFFGHVNFSKMLVSNSANVNLTDHDGNSPLHFAATTENYVMVTLLVQSGADINAVDIDGDTALLNAAIKGYQEIAKILVEAGADLMTHNCMGYTPLHAAAQKGGIEFCEYLLDQGIPIDPMNYYGATPLHLAAIAGEGKVVEFLISRGARVNFPYMTNSPLHYAAAQGHMPILKLLLSVGANVSAKNAVKKTPLHSAAFEGRAEACSALLDAGSNVNALDEDKRTALHMVAMNKGIISVAKILVDNGAKITALDRGGLTPCELGRSYKNEEFCRWLEQQMQDDQPQKKKSPKRKKRSRAKK